MQVTGRVLWLKPEGKAGKRFPSLKALSLKHTSYYLKDHNYPSQQKHHEISQQSPLVNSSTSKGFEGPWVFGILSRTDSLVPVNVVKLTVPHHWEQWHMGFFLLNKRLIFTNMKTLKIHFSLQFGWRWPTGSTAMGSGGRRTKKQIHKCQINMPCSCKKAWWKNRSGA